MVNSLAGRRGLYSQETTGMLSSRWNKYSCGSTSISILSVGDRRPRRHVDRQGGNPAGAFASLGVQTRCMLSLEELKA